MISQAACSVTLAVLFSSLSAVTADAAGLGGSPESMRLQHDVAVENDYEFMGSPAQLRRLVAAGRLTELTGNADYRLARVSYPYAQPEVLLFVERLAAQYRKATGSQLVVTSLTRPSSEQPRNAHKLSVHPAGMAIDFRIPKAAPERAWLERTLLELENSGVLDVTRERNPPHYHVAVFPAEYRAYAAVRTAAEEKAKGEAAALLAVANRAATASAAAPIPAERSVDTSGTAPLLALLGFSFFAIPAVLLRRSARASENRDRF